MLIVLLLIIIVGLDCFFAVSNANSSYNWSSTNGIVITSKYTPASDKVSDSLDLTYSYTVNNVTYESKNIDPVGPFFFTYILDNGLIDKSLYAQEYPAGSTVRVYYDPSNPSVSTLNRGWAFSNFIELALLSIIVFSSVVSIIFSNKNPNLNYSFNVFQRIFILIFLNLLVFIITFLVVSALLVIYIILIIILSVILTNLIFTSVDFITYFLSNFFPTNLVLTSSYLVLLVIFLFALIFICMKAYKSLSVRKSKRYPYQIIDKKIEYDIVSNKWFLTFTCSFKISGLTKNVTHTVKKKFSSQQKAEKFFEKRIKPVEVPASKLDDNDNIKNYRSSIPLSTLIQYYSKGVVYVHSDSTYSTQEVIFSYEILSILLLSFIPLFFLTFDGILPKITNFFPIIIHFSSSSILSSILENSIQIISFIFIMTVILLVDGIEILFLLYIPFKLVKFYIDYIYKPIFWGKN